MDDGRLQVKQGTTKGAGGPPAIVFEGDCILQPPELAPRGFDPRASVLLARHRIFGFST